MATERRSTGHPQFSSYEKTNAVLRLLKGEPADSVSEELGVSLRRLERWRDDFVNAGSAELARRRDLPRHHRFDKLLQAAKQWLFLLLALAAIIALLSIYSQRDQ